MTVNDALNLAEPELLDAGVDGPRITAELLMAFALGTDRAGVYSRLRDELAGPEADRFFAVLKRRAGREPLQHITGVQEFFGLKLNVTPDTLVPRPETELLVEEALRLLGGAPSAKVADIGTGSGCIAVALAVNAPKATVYAVDKSGAALAVAAANAQWHGVTGRVVFLAGELFGPLKDLELEGGLDVIVSNPPYIPSADIPGLQPEVRFDPAGALDGGVDGLDIIRDIIKDAHGFLKPGGTLLVEIGEGQSGAVKELVEGSGTLGFEMFLLDLSGIERVLVARRKMQ